MKDNKITYMCGKLGMMHTECNLIAQNTKDEGIVNGLKVLQKAIRVLQEDLELLRKCTLDNPDFKWDNDNSDYKEKQLRGNEV